MQIEKCHQCGTDNTVIVCERCGRLFVLTSKRAAGGSREDDDFPLSVAPETEVQPCDFCQSQDDKERLDLSIVRGLTQRTCPVCHTAFLKS